VREVDPGLAGKGRLLEGRRKRWPPGTQKPNRRRDVVSEGRVDQEMVGLGCARELWDV
jgi:hypothetical protein